MVFIFWVVMGSRFVFFVGIFLWWSFYLFLFVFIFMFVVLVLGIRFWVFNWDCIDWIVIFLLWFSDQIISIVFFFFTTVKDRVMFNPFWMLLIYFNNSYIIIYSLFLTRYVEKRVIPFHVIYRLYLDDI